MAVPAADTKKPQRLSEGTDHSLHYRPIIYITGSLLL